MRIQTLRKSLEILTQVFSQKAFDSEIYWNFLKNLDDEAFLSAVEDVCRTQKEIYPGTNLIAILIERTTQIKTKPQLLALPEGEKFAAISTKEWNELKEKLRLQMKSTEKEPAVNFGCLG